ncbi:MAG: bifunctional diguanylate cyclase/phosphodiesterase [Faecalibacterium sp.]|nr:bifunctional diguanylate cyclase/phosphodiesterase [Faecalibacterium sp.]
MQNHKPHSQKAPQTGHSIFGTILFSLLAVLAAEFLLLTFAVHATRLGPQLNQNAEDILAMQVDNRSRYLQSIFHDAQELTSLSDTINGLTQQLLDEGEISLSTLDSSSDAAYPLLEAAAPELISTHYITLRVTHIMGESASEVGLAEDMTTTVLEQQRIEHERDYDTLTGLYRRRAFDRACDALFQQPEKLGCAALLMMDLDNLKQINDTYGHDWGDQYIRQTGQCFAANTPANTICSRLSGDEFLIFFYGYQDQAQLRTQLELLSAALQRSVSILPNGKQLHISISGGIAWYPTDGHDLLTLKKYADFAMYQVKHSHKGRMCDFDIGSYHQEAYAAQTQQDFERLLQEELVSYHFQPICSARSGRVAAYEALMRVDLPTLHSPAQVMQLAHETGRLYEIERITVFHSSEIFQRMQAQGLLQSDALLFINSIANVSLTVEDVEEYAQRYPELLKRLVVEITEQEDLDRACLERKRNVPGFSGSFALDDYGSGYSNELNLLELSPRYIKIDISIVRGIDTDRDKQQIVSNIVAYAHARSMQLIAEGIETEAQLRTVIGLGVDLLQGYYLSRPAAVPAPIAPAAQAVIDQLEHQRFNPLGL